MNAPHDLPRDYWLRLAVARDGDEAQEWREALEDAGVEVAVRIDDAQSAQPGSSPLTAVGAASLQFVYQIFVPHDQRDQAATALIDAGWRASGDRGVSTQMLLKGAVMAIGVAILLVVTRNLVG